jgi:hypothetical protein
MFAVVALPDTDPSNPSSDPAKEPPMLKVDAKTQWVHFDQVTGTVNAKYPGFWHWSAKPLPEAKTVALSGLPTLATRTVEEGLGASVTNVRTFQTTNSNTTLEISGTNFYPGTTVRIGDKTFSGPKDGLFVQSSQTMVLTANADLLTGALSAVVNGRYGPPSPLYQTKQPGIVISQSEISPKGPNYSSLKLMVDAFDSSGLSMADIKNYPDPILTLNGTRIGYRASFQDTSQGGHKYVMARVDIPNSLLQPEDNRAGILFPLLGESWSAEDLIYDSDAVQVTKMSTGKTTTLLISRPGQEFSGNWHIVLDKTYSLTDPPSTTITRAKTPKHPAAKRVKGKASVKDKTKTQEVEFSRLVPCKKSKIDTNRCSMVRLVADSKFLSSYQKFVLISDTGYAQTIDLSARPAKEKTAAAKNALKITSVEPSTVGLNEVVTVTVTGTGLESVKHVSFDGKPLSFWKGEKKTGGKTSPPPTDSSGDSNGKSEQPPGQLEVLLSRDLTAKEGHQTFLLLVDDITVATASITVGPAPTATVISPAKSSEAKEKTP